MLRPPSPILYCTAVLTGSAVAPEPVTVTIITPPFWKDEDATTATVTFFGPDDFKVSCQLFVREGTQHTKHTSCAHNTLMLP